ncbi:hypothetical protein RND81_07G017800 [Saponaria officinalis]|uniref:Uncharacterized protein n=1 Tax=Saponaria officinalis TaxID=3572 RepID=A0AAW1JKX6_SAPOF
MEIQGRNEGVMKNLYESLKPIIWVLSVEGVFKQQLTIHSLTGFAIDRDGHVMTCAHGGWQKWSGVTIKARPLCGTDGFEFEATVVNVRLKNDMCLLKIPTTFEAYGRFGSGNLEIGENVMTIGHPNDCVGSGVVGQVVYPCTADANFAYDDFHTCDTYMCDSMMYTPDYRIMGHFWNYQYLRSVKPPPIFEKNLQANLPVIQCSGLVGGAGSSGAPIFNLRGEIVGMLAMGFGGYEIGLHVTGLKKFIQASLGLPIEVPGGSQGGQGSSSGINISKRSRN